MRVGLRSEWALRRLGERPRQVDCEAKIVCEVGVGIRSGIKASRTGGKRGAPHFGTTLALRASPSRKAAPDIARCNCSKIADIYARVGLAAAETRARAPQLVIVRRARWVPKPPAAAPPLSLASEAGCASPPPFAPLCSRSLRKILLSGVFFSSRCPARVCVFIWVSSLLLAPGQK